MTDDLIARLRSMGFRQMAADIEQQAARIAALEGALREALDLAEYWFMRGYPGAMSESDWKRWHALGYGSNAYRDGRAAIRPALSMSMFATKADYEAAVAEQPAVVHTITERLVPLEQPAKAEQSLAQRLREKGFERAPFPNAADDAVLDVRWPEAQAEQPASDNTGVFMNMPNPTPCDLVDPQFNAIWNVIKDWDVNVPAHYQGYCGANGSHVMLILQALRAQAEQPASDQDAAIDDLKDEINFHCRVRDEEIERLQSAIKALEAERDAWQATADHHYKEAFALKADAERYRWILENATIETETWRHDGKDPASTKQPLDNAIDKARGAA